MLDDVEDNEEVQDGGEERTRMPPRPKEEVVSCGGTLCGRRTGRRAAQDSEYGEQRPTRQRRRESAL